MSSYMSTMLHFFFFLSYLKKLDVFIEFYECFAYIYVCTPRVCSVSTEVRGGHWMS